ncbi:MAG: oligosaccharide flippase family protein [Acidobacteriota bacterium]
MTGDPTLLSRFVRSSAAAALSQGWRVLVTFGSMLVLKRLIAPEDWGLVDWMLPIFLVLGAVRDLGLIYHIVRLPEPRPYGNLLRLEIVWGGALGLAALLLAPYASVIYRDPHPDLAAALRAMVLFLLFEGLATVPKIYLETELRIGRAVVPELLRNAVMAGGAIALALLDYGAWAVIVSQVAAAALYAALLWWRVRGQIRLVYLRGQTLRLVHQSLPLAVIWFLTIFVRHIDPLILAFRFDAETVGNYAFAYQNAFRVSEILVPALARALYPALVALAGAAAARFRAFALTNLAVLAVEVPAAYALAINAELAIRILGGDAWMSSPSFLRILCFAPLVDPFSRLGGELLKADHQDRLWIAATLLTLLSYAGGGLLLTGLYGPIAMAWVNLLPLGAPLMAWGLYRMAPAAFRAMVRDLAFVYAAPIPLFALAVGGAAALTAPLGLGSAGADWLRFGLSLLASLASLGLFYHRFGDAFLAFVRGARRGGDAAAVDTAESAP